MISSRLELFLEIPALLCLDLFYGGRSSGFRRFNMGDRCAGTSKN